MKINSIFDNDSFLLKHVKRGRTALGTVTLRLDRPHNLVISNNLLDKFSITGTHCLIRATNTSEKNYIHVGLSFGNEDSITAEERLRVTRNKITNYSSISATRLFTYIQSVTPIYRKKSISFELVESECGLNRLLLKVRESELQK